MGHLALEFDFSQGFTNIFDHVFVSPQFNTETQVIWREGT